MLHKYLPLQLSKSFFRQTNLKIRKHSTIRNPPPPRRRLHHRNSPSRLNRTDNPTSPTNLLCAILGGAAAGSLFVNSFEYLVWGNEHDHLSFRRPGDELLETKATDENVYETASGVPEGVIGDIWKAFNPNVVILEESSEPIQRMLAQVRDHRTSGPNFVFYANRLWMLLLEQALCEIDEQKTSLILTPSGHRYKGSFLPEGVKLCGISLQTNVVEANTQALNSLLQSLQSLLNAEGCNLSQFGEVVVEKEHNGSTNGTTNGTNGTFGAKVSKSVLPSDIRDRYALIVHPTLSTGTSTLVAVNHLVKEKGVPEDHIMVLVLLACPESIESMNTAFPNVKIVTAALDSHLDPDTNRIVPGLGDFGSRYAFLLNRRGDDEDEEEGRLRRERLELDGGMMHGNDQGINLKLLKKRKTRRRLQNRRSEKGRRVSGR